ncbi:MAG: class I tRNA ligase family protein, partial [Bryobacterales bacterium]|nr:class I tRNA ligase family protein [Bryobacterales bacterium]
RFVGMSLERAGAEVWTPDSVKEVLPLSAESSGRVSLADRWIFSRLRAVAAEANEQIDAFRYHEVAGTLYHYFWHEFCDWYIELKKLSFADGSGLTNGWRNMLAATERSLRLLHPIMPFITEDLWQRLAANTPGRPRSIALADYPQPVESDADPDAERRVEILQALVATARNLRAELGLPPKDALQGTVFSEDGITLEVVRSESGALRRLANLQATGQQGAAEAGQALGHTSDFDLAIQLPEERRVALRGKLAKRLAKLTEAQTGAEDRLNNPAFAAKAPEHVVNALRQKLSDYASQAERIRNTLSGL